VVDELGSRAEVEHAYRILDEGSSADRQIKAWQASESFPDVVDHLVAETREDVLAVHAETQG
jgi:carboxylate-amine ligase